jgi:Ca2+/Na+ antiporter
VVGSVALVATVTGNKLVRWEGFALSTVYPAFVVVAF